MASRGLAARRASPSTCRRISCWRRTSWSGCRRCSINTQLPASCLELELTENVLQTGAATIAVLHQLRELGVSIAHRRLRYRLFLADVARAVAADAREDRSQPGREHRQRRALAGDRALDHRTEPQPGLAGDCGGRRTAHRSSAQLLQRSGRADAGLPDFAAAVACRGSGFVEATRAVAAWTLQSLPCRDHRHRHHRNSPRAAHAALRKPHRQLTTPERARSCRSGTGSADFSVRIRCGSRERGTAARVRVSRAGRRSAGAQVPQNQSLPGSTGLGPPCSRSCWSRCCYGQRRLCWCRWRWASFWRLRCRRWCGSSTACDLPRFLGVALTMALALASSAASGTCIADQFTDLSTQVTQLHLFDAAEGRRPAPRQQRDLSTVHAHGRSCH